MSALAAWRVGCASEFESALHPGRGPERGGGQRSARCDQRGRKIMFQPRSGLEAYNFVL
jgi:hypothetical protein